MNKIHCLSENNNNKHKKPASLLLLSLDQINILLLLTLELMNNLQFTLLLPVSSVTHTMNAIFCATQEKI